jgi:hypothetical protein
VKSSRSWLLVFLAALLPIKAALAATMLCPPAGVGTQGELRAVQGSAAGFHDGSPVRSVHEHPAHEHGSAASDRDVPPGPHDPCSVCSAFCSVTPLVGGLPSVFAPPTRSVGVFPDLSAPPPSFLSDGQERPPRTI